MKQTRQIMKKGKYKKMNHRVLLFSGSLSLVSIACAGTFCSVAGLAPLTEEDVARLATGSAQEILAIVCAILVVAVLGLSLVIGRLFRYMEKRHIMSHEERDRREASFHEAVESMLVAVSDSTAATRECNQILSKVESVMARCHEETLILTGSDSIKIGKDLKR